MPESFPKNKIQLYGPKNPRNNRKREGCDGVGTKHVNRRSIVAEEQRAAVSWTPPETLLAKCEIPPAGIRSDIGVEKSELIGGSQQELPAARGFVGLLRSSANRQWIGQQPREHTDIRPRTKA